jgi:hypothetical protein
MYANRLQAETEFFLYLLEHYARRKGVPAHRVLTEWDDAGATVRIRDNYVMYHSEALENAFRDIDSILAGDRSQ